MTSAISTQTAPCSFLEQYDWQELMVRQLPPAAISQRTMSSSTQWYFCIFVSLQSVAREPVERVGLLMSVGALRASATSPTPVRTSSKSCIAGWDFSSACFVYAEVDAKVGDRRADQ